LFYSIINRIVASYSQVILQLLYEIAAKQSQPTVNTTKRSQQLMDYLVTQEPAVLKYRKSDMMLAVHSNASYLNEEEAQSQPAATTSYLKTYPPPRTTEQFTTSSKSLKESCHPQPKLNSVPCTLMHPKQLKYKLF
jgi:hypothetical protein